MKRKRLLFRYLLSILFCLLCAGYVLTYIFVFSSVAMGEDPALVNAISGTLLYDSSFSSNGNHLMTVFISRAENTYENKVDARGIVTVISNEKSIITCGEKILAKGKFSGDLFIASDITVVGKSAICHLRQFLIQVLEKRLDNDYFSSALLLGRAEDSQLEIKTLAQRSGCLHILALSGMHLNVIGTICKKVFGKKRTGKVLSYLLVTLFVFIAGPRPSLIRALFMFYFSFLPVKQRLELAFVLQLVFFPLTMMNIGSLYGYAAVFALVFIAPYMTQLIDSVIVYPLLKTFVTSLSVTLLIAPVSLVMSGEWCWSSVFISPICSVLITVCMVEGILTLTLGNAEFLCQLKTSTYQVLSYILTIGSEAGTLGWKSLVFLYSVLLVCLTIRVMRNKFFPHDLLSSLQVLK